MDVYGCNGYQCNGNIVTTNNKMWDGGYIYEFFNGVRNRSESQTWWIVNCELLGGRYIYNIYY